MNLEEVNTIPTIPLGYIRHFFRSRDRKIVTDIKRHADHTCHAKVSPDYIRNSLNKFDQGIIYYKGEVVKGFAVWKERLTEPRNVYKDMPFIHPEKYIELLLVCSSLPESTINRKVNDRIGSRLLYDIERYSLEKSFKFITLQPASSDLIDFYLKSGYMVDPPNPITRVPLTMIKSIKPFKISKTATTRRRREPKGTYQPLAGRLIEYYNTLVHPALQNSHTYELLDEYYKRWHSI